MNKKRITYILITALIIAIICLISYPQIQKDKEAEELLKKAFLGRFSDFPACNNLDLKNKIHTDYCKTLNDVDTRISILRDNQSKYIQLAKEVEHLLSETNYRVISSDTPLFLQREFGELVASKIQALPDFSYMMEECMDVLIFNSTYEALEEGLSSCKKELWDEVSEYREKMNELNGILDKYKALSPSHIQELKNEIEECNVRI